MSEDRYIDYQNSIKNFLENKSELFSCNKFADDIVSKIMKKIDN